ncbi:MAG: tRNA lysidine(34) synthetase TilS [Prevotella sp.]|nr:tRNA lysidine(34) synthetase TilS [Prevotella sp.]
MLSKPFLKKISEFIASHNLLNREEIQLVALSGGADSVCLTLALLQLGYPIETAHCNFHLRGEESERDENFCTEFCKKNGIKPHLAHFDTVSFAKMHKISIEMAARELRYTYFRQLRKDIGAETICVAHHQDDSVETVIMNLIRGTGINGLTGIQAKNGYIVRPLLCVTRNEIENELKAECQDFVTDSTNLVDDMVRNKIRLDIIPLMRKINPSVNDSIAKTAERLGEITRAFNSIIENEAEHAVSKDRDDISKISINSIKASVSPENLLFHILKTYTFTPSQIEQVYNSLDSEPGRLFFSPTHQLLIDRDVIIIEPLSEAIQKIITIPEEGTYVFNEKIKFRVEIADYNKDTIINKEKNCVCADLSKLILPLTIRNTKIGDRFIPFGMKGSKLVSDYLTDIKLNLFEKKRQLVLTDSNNKIIWLVNNRPDNRFRIDDKTKIMLKITCITN